MSKKPEDLVQARVKDLYARAGGKVYDTSQGYRPPNCGHCGKSLGKGAASTRITEGLADLLVLFPGGSVWHEVKAISAKLLRPRLPLREPWLGTFGAELGRIMPEVQLRGVLTIPNFYDRALEAIGWEERERLYRKAQSDDQKRFEAAVGAAGVGPSGQRYILGGELEAAAWISEHHRLEALLEKPHLTPGGRPCMTP